MNTFDMILGGHLEVESNMQQTIYDIKMNKSVGYVFRTQSNIYYKLFLQ